MKPRSKPAFLSADRAEAFEDWDAVASYRNRPDYSRDVIKFLENLTVDSGPILDVGCGTGFVARPLAQKRRVDAVDISVAMVETGKKLPGGDSKDLTWLVEPFETIDLTGPYSLITAAESLHWMAWDDVLPKCERLLAPFAKLAIVDHRPLPLPWESELSKLIAEFSLNPGYRPYDMASELSDRDLFVEEDRFRTPPDPFILSVEDYVDSFHARAAFSRSRMGARAVEFDDKLRSIVQATDIDEVVISRVTEIVWGRPKSAHRSQRRNVR